MLRLTAVAAVAVSGVSADLAEKWDHFKEKFGKEYSDAKEALHRFKTFAENVARAEQMKIMNPEAEFSYLSPLADMTPDEFHRRNALRVTRAELEAHATQAAKDSLELQLPTGEQELPSEFDWVKKGGTNAVKDQGMCGSCWAFSTVANIEGNYFVRSSAKGKGVLHNLSEQEIVDCDDVNQGCNGGLPSEAMKTMIAHDRGMEGEHTYPPYEARDDTCRYKPSKAKVFLQSYKMISHNENAIAQALMKFGPLSIALNADGLQMYSGGVYDPWFCNPLGLNHAVTLVGFGQTGSGFFDKKWWNVRNSWGESWGESGHFRIRRGKGKCGMNRMAVTAIADVDKAVSNENKFLAAPADEDESMWL